jgi:NADH dehydrogenase (ubiquinone) flavoprotein 2
MNRRLESQGSAFTFSAENLKKSQKAISQYPAGRQASAVKSILDLAQRQNEGWVSQEVVEEVAKLLDMPFIRVYEVASFYTMFNLSPIGKTHVQVCTTTPCWLRGADEIFEHCKKRAASIEAGAMTVAEVECIGACVNAPVIMIGNDFYEDLNLENLDKVIDSHLLADSPYAAVPGSQTGRLNSAPSGYTFEKKEFDEVQDGSK